MHIAELLVS